MGSHDPQAQPPTPLPAKPSIIVSWLAHRRAMAQIHAGLERERRQDRAEARQQKEQARQAKAARPRPPSLLTRVFTHATVQRTVERQNLRHIIQVVI